MKQSIELLVYFLIGIQFLYLLAVYFPFLFVKSQSNTEALPPVSVIIACHNEYENLQELIPILLKQKYHDFEIIVVLDRTDDDSHFYLGSLRKEYRRLRVVSVEQKTNYFSPKKNALTQGVLQAQNDVLLLTDADCRPVSDFWIEKMASTIGTKDIVLGYSPYLKAYGFLNIFIRYETFMGALIQFTSAWLKMPIAGTGRNLMYRKSVFLRNKGFGKFSRNINGDDDLLINQMATSKNTTFCLDKDSFMFSKPKNTFGKWYTQKKRHLSDGVHYNLLGKFLVGINSFLKVCFWIIAPALYFYTQSTNFSIVLFWGGCLLVHWALVWVFYFKLDKNFTVTLFPFLDFIYSFYLVLAAIVSRSTNSQTIKWH